MKSFVAVCCSLVAAVAANVAVAGPFERGGMGFRPFVQDQRSRPGPQREAARPAPQRDMRPPGEADRGRMSPDERRQLRRDIQDAGKDIYQRDRQAPRRQQRR